MALIFLGAHDFKDMLVYILKISELKKSALIQ